MKIQWKSMYVRCIDCMNLFKNLNSLSIDRMNLFKNLNSLNVQNCENSRKNCVHQMYRQYEFVQKFELIDYVKS